MKKIPITKLLYKNQMLSETDLTRMEQEPASEDQSEIEVLEALQIASADTILQYLSQIYHMEILDVEKIDIKKEVIDEIPHEISRKLGILPIKSDDHTILIALSDPTNISAIETLSYYTFKKITFALAKRDMIHRVFSVHTSQTKSMEAVETLKREFQSKEVDTLFDNVLDDQSDAPTIQLTNSIVSQAITLNASDIHVEPYEEHMNIRYRIDGKLKEVMQLPSSIYNAVAARLKLISGMDISERRIPQEGRLEVELNDFLIDIRFSTIPNVYGEKIVMRLLQKKHLNQNISDLGFSQVDYEKVMKMVQRPNGIILVTGPTGSGKSTTLYSFLNHMKTPEKSIVTVEDPVEYTIVGFNQTQVNTKQGMTFPIALRAILRQDPDIIMIGEIRDEETASIAVRASITGHLVLSTLHTNDAISTISRLIDMHVEPYLISDSLRGVIAQRLMRRLCPECKKKHKATLAEQKLLRVNQAVDIYEPVGCVKCNHTGYSGRFAVFEVLELTQELKRIIQMNVDHNELRDAVVASRQYKSLYDSGIVQVLKGNTSLQELSGLDNGE